MLTLSLPHRTQTQQKSEEQAIATDSIMAFPTSSQQQTLKLADIQSAYEEYDQFVKATHVFGQLSIEDFRIRRQMPLNTPCAQIFLTKTSHLTENDFIEIDRPVLNTIGQLDTAEGQASKREG